MQRVPSLVEEKYLGEVTIWLRRPTDIALNGLVISNTGFTCVHLGLWVLIGVGMEQVLQQCRSGLEASTEVGGRSQDGGAVSGEGFQVVGFCLFGFKITKPDLYTWAGCLGSQEDEQVDTTSHSPPCCLSRSGSLTTTGTTRWSRARAGASLKSLKRTLVGLVALLGTLRVVT